jgi:hypothetical protein
MSKPSLNPADIKGMMAGLHERLLEAREVDSPAWSASHLLIKALDSVMQSETLSGMQQEDKNYVALQVARIGSKPDAVKELALMVLYLLEVCATTIVTTYREEDDPADEDREQLHKKIAAVGTAMSGMIMSYFETTKPLPNVPTDKRKEELLARIVRMFDAKKNAVDPDGLDPEDQ